ncbi:MAG TPA: hypothetical protein VLM40_01315, partial [Gemmata sp.]|nr:hypothetical protein [Gemmata sp.]
MAKLTGQGVQLSLPRRFICDLLHASRNVPVITFERRIEVSPILAVREQMDRPPAWSLILAKAFAVVAAGRPELRRTYLPLPWPRMWEADESVASIAFERDFRGEPAVFFGRLAAPERRSLAEMAARLHEWKTRPLGDLRDCRRLLRYARLPLIARRFLWWCGTAWCGKAKAKNFGTFGVSLTGTGNATALNLLSPLTTTINTGMIQPDGSLDVRLHFDHRVLDGMPAARALEEFEEVLRTAIVAELEEMT